MNKIFSKEHNTYFALDFIVKVFGLYIVYCTNNSLIPEYTMDEFTSLIKGDEFPEDFMVKLLYHARLEDLNPMEHIVK
jgi:hypothetical protein